MPKSKYYKGSSILPSKEKAFQEMENQDQIQIIPDSELNLEQDFNRGGNWADDFCNNLLKF